MSGFISEPLRINEKTSSAHGHGSATSSAQGQNNLHVPERGESGPTVTTSDPKEMDISAGQKMLSAVSGSLLTSLLGTFSILVHNPHVRS